MRTVYATIGQSGVTPLWQTVEYACVLLMTSAMGLATAIGVYRYNKIAQIVCRKNIPERFGRASITPLNVVVASVVATVAAAAVLQGFEEH